MRDALRWQQDTALVLLVLVAGLVPCVAMRHDLVPNIIVALLVAACVALRRRRPLSAFASVQLLGIAVTALHLIAADTAGFVLAYIVLIYGVAASSHWRSAGAALAFGLAAFWSQDEMVGHGLIEYAAGAALAVAPWAVGRYVRRDRELRTALLAALGAERAALARAAVAEERQRIAREMHQIVAHGLSAIAVQSNAAEAALLADPHRARGPVREINVTARRCVDEMRVLLTVLRTNAQPRNTSTPADAPRYSALRRPWMLRDHVLTAAVLVLGLTLALTGAHDAAFAATVSIACAVPVAFRRRTTLLPLAAVTVLAVSVTALHPQPELGAVYAIASLLTFLPVTMRPDRTAFVALAMELAGFWSIDAMSGHPPSGFFASAVTVGGVWGIGSVIGRVRVLHAQVVAATEAERNALASGASADERRRLAREMHDVVAHGLSAIALQSGAAEAALDVDVARAVTAVETIAALASECAAEMRELLGVLGVGDADDLVPGADLRAQLGSPASIGPTVRVRIDDGVLNSLDQQPAVAHAAARMVQEALTNVRRHSHARTATVDLRWAGASVRLMIIDTGPPRMAMAQPAGHGTTGIRERVAVLGGECTVGPYQGGWRVDVLLPAPIDKSHVLLGTPRMTSVLVVDDEAVIRDGLSLIIEFDPTLTLAGTARDGQAAAAFCDEQAPDVVLMDLNMPGWDGIRTTRHLTERHPKVRVVALTTFSAEHKVWQALRAGACGYLLKDTPRERLTAAVHAAARGETPISPELLGVITDRFTAAPQPVTNGVPASLANLSERELDVLRLLAAGKTNAEIAAQLQIGQATVKTHVANLLGKLDVRDRVQAVIVAYETGLVRAGGR